MADLQALFQAVNELSAEDLKELYRYITETRMEFTNPPAEEQPDTNKPRILGLHAHLGKAWMSDDFDDELPDEFWFGEQ